MLGEVAMVTEENIVPIDRAKWRNGRYTKGDCDLGDPMLLNNEGGRCCLGFLGTACGVSDESMLGEELPGRLFSIDIEKYPKALFRSNWNVQKWENYFEAALSKMNDAEDVPDELREDWIAAGFRISLDRNVVFHGEYPPL